MIYLDHNATTPVASEVREAMLPFLGKDYANPSSPYTYAHSSAAAVSHAREQVAALCGCKPGGVVFTSGGTESNATVLLGLPAGGVPAGLVTTTVEHSSVRNTAKYLSERGMKVVLVNVDASGILDEAAYREALTPDVGLVSVMAANNETGHLFPVASLAAMAHERGILFHTDAVQMAGKNPIDFETWDVDFLSLSAHKFHGPKGVGALCLREGLTWPPLFRGGDQEAGRRAGTENVPGIVGLGRAAELVLGDLVPAGEQMKGLRDHLERDLLRAVPGLRIAGEETPRLPNTTAVLLDHIESEAVLTLLDMEGICCSSGSACTSGSTEPSHVLNAMGLTTQAAQAAIRFSLSRMTTLAEVEKVVQSMTRIVERLRIQ